MRIINRNGERLLQKDDYTEVFVKDGDIIQYTGIYHKSNNEKENIETLFVGIIVSERYRYDKGLMGIYVDPLYILLNNRWSKIINKPPPAKYSLYPHLLLLPEFYYHYYPIYYLHTCENVDITHYKDIQTIIDFSISYNY